MMTLSCLLCKNVSFGGCGTKHHELSTALQQAVRILVDRVVCRSRDEVALQKFATATFCKVMTRWRYLTQKSTAAQAMHQNKVGGFSLFV